MAYREDYNDDESDAYINLRLELPCLNIMIVIMPKHLDAVAFVVVILGVGFEAYGSVRDVDKMDEGVHSQCERQKDSSSQLR